MRLRLVIVSMAVTSMVALAFLIPLMLLTRDLARDRVLLEAEKDAETAAQLLSAASADADPSAVFNALGYTSLSLVLPNGEIAGAAVPVGEDLSGPLAGAAGNKDVAGGVAVYVPVLNSAGQILVLRNFVPDAALSQNVGRSWLVLGSLGAVLVGVAVAVADWLGRSMVKPVRDLSQAASKLGEGLLDTRVEPSGPPELARVGTEFNHLAGRVTELLQQERETAADLSHRLRTPLTAARLDAESLPAGELRERVLDDLAELERSIDHIINDARRPSRTAPDRVDLAAVLNDRAAFWDALAEEQGRTSSLFIASSGPLWCVVDAAEFAAAVDALLGNAFAHTAEGVPYALTLEPIAGVAVLTVEDEGPGFASGDVVTRGRSDGDSTGLGLDIARSTAETAGGTFEIGSSPRGGARVTMRLPLDTS